MKKVLLLASVVVFFASASAQNDFPYTFTEVKNNAATETKDQCNTGTCWSFATASFIESELIRMGKGEHNLSEMYNVRVTYPMKAGNYVRYQGKAQFGPGSLSHDVIKAIERYGVVPESVYDGLDPDQKRHDHSEMDAVLLGMVENLVKNSRGSLSSDWIAAVNAVLDVYLGAIPESFEYKGKKYTPASFRDELGIKAADYINITSFTHHPFYGSFILEVPDNFSQGSFYNMPIDEMVSVVEDALMAGYTVAWDADVSEKGFSFRNGMAIMPAEGVSKEQMFSEVVKEEVVTQKSRQDGFDAQQTTDDHLMHITGIAKDQDGKTYFITKNSWGDGNAFGGYQYISLEYFKAKTISVMIHKSALNKDVKKKLDLAKQ
jgi:bleomycin hydrolase